MEDLREVNYEELVRPGPGSLADERAAEELGLDMWEFVRMMDVWMKHAGEVAREGARRRREKVASPTRTVLK